MMKQAWVGLAVLLLIVLAGCSDSQQVACNAPYQVVDGVCCLDENTNRICDDQEEVPSPVRPDNKAPEIELEPEQPSDSEGVVVNPEPEPAPVQKTEDAGQQVQQLLAELDEGVDSYSYVRGGDRITVRGTKIKIAYGKFRKVQGNTSINTVYLDTISRKAVAYCEGDSRVVVSVCGKEIGPFDAEYQNHQLKTPVEWLNEFRFDVPTEVKESAQNIDDRVTDLWIFEKGGVTYRFHIDHFYKVPLRIYQKNGLSESVLSYQDPFFNTAKEEDFKI